MQPVPEIDLAELVEECIPIAKREFAIKIKLEKIWATYWADVSQIRAEKARMIRHKRWLAEQNRWMRPY